MPRCQHGSTDVQYTGNGAQRHLNFCLTVGPLEGWVFCDCPELTALVKIWCAASICLTAGEVFVPWKASRII